MTRFETYISGIITALQAAVGLPAVVERSIVLAFTREEPAVLVVHAGSEVLDHQAPMQVAYRQRELLLTIVTRDEVPDRRAGEIMEIAHPVVMAYSAAGLISIMEIQTDEPKFVKSDVTGAVIVVHYRITYRTAETSLTS